ncbi:MAG: HNH endonuclease [Candidatus Sigynarchaeota archaeon]
MPPAAVKSLGDLLFWQYAKIISVSAGLGKKNFGFIMSKYKKLQSGEIAWNSIREYVKEHESDKECIICGAKDQPLTADHLFPRKHNGPNDANNIAWVCRSCNSSKGARRLYEFYTATAGIEVANYDVPRIAEGKYLKLLHAIFSDANMLDYKISDITAHGCPACDLKPLCIKEGTEGRLSILCLDGLATIALRE